MAKRLEKKNSPGRWADRLTEGINRAVEAARPLVGKSALRLSATVLVLLGAYSGITRLEDYVHGQARFEQPLRLEWVDPPAWLCQPENRHILEELYRQVALDRDDRLLDQGLAARLGRALSTSKAAWVKEVERVQVRPDGIVGIKCQFREPRAWVQQGAVCYLVDEDRCRLPGRYAAADCKQTGLLTITGVRGKVGDVGQVWSAGDLAAGIDVVGKLGGEAFHRQVIGVDVSNHEGRQDRNRPHIELVTNRKGSRILWGRAPGQESGVEISAAQKVTLLQTLYRQWGRIDMNRSYVDITTWPDRVALPRAMHASAPDRLLRG